MSLLEQWWHAGIILGASAAAAALLALLRGRKGAKEGIRAARLGDAAAIVAYTKALALESEGCTLNDAAVRRGVRFMISSLLGLRPRCWVWEKCGRVVGMVAIGPEWSDWHGREYWWVLTMYVDPQHRGQGIAKSLLTKVKALAEQEGVQTINLRVERSNETAQRLYRSVGFAVDDSHLVMAWGHTPAGAPVGASV
eukprot:CAMPEP_0171069960 /NCGR_PEP_ID=MMETSP0766_2-20121228/9461_1 /TAXON_ID=439317 /ORGANISM="Gambierdiscus australes, Strain CAWD 149" /LENGTH=195 /DNA_ID=CAMNT_0011526383 /DNA_START=20 /DNA_END=607 /DNA_ORIENTATION=-